MLLLILTEERNMSSNLFDLIYDEIIEHFKKNNYTKDDIKFIECIM